MFSVFDLDGTVICSEHRKATLPDGSLDLDHWIENNTPEKILADSLLPMAKMMQNSWKRGDTVIICTARVLQDSDFYFFMLNDLQFHHVLSRPQGCSMADEELKDIQLRMFAHDRNMSWRQFCVESVVFDDNLSVLTRLKSIGMDVVDASQMNKALAA
mgnify:FL=1